MGSSVTFEILKTLGAVAGVVALLWRAWDEVRSHLRISIRADGPKDGWLTVLTTVDNKGNRPKKIKYAFLLVGPETDGPLETARRLAGQVKHSGPLDSTNDLADFVTEDSLFQGDSGIVPLKFYYRENVDIADETITYRAPLDAAVFRHNTAYSVRFFLFPAEGQLHRSTHDCFIA